VNPPDLLLSVDIQVQRTGSGAGGNHWFHPLDGGSQEGVGGLPRGDEMVYFCRYSASERIIVVKTIVITGSTRGIGYGLADAFLDLGCAVAVSGRTAAAVEEAVSVLSTKHPPERVFGYPCDVTRFDQVQALWDATSARFGRIDVWINNAGISNFQMAIWEYPPELIEAVIGTNLVGAMYGAKVALKGMLAQGSGSLYNMEGLGSDGRRVPGLTLYGTTKSGLRYLTDALVEETEGAPILVGALRPGMVMTELVTRQYKGRPEDWERVKRVFNILADRVETVAPWLARRVLDNKRNGVRFTWLSRPKLMMRFLTAPFVRRRVIE
jgi:NAD(P)-dependent dehydrogenase (short-subunit alcohol dehydrogenase family)